MSESDDAKKKPRQQPTTAWEPEELDEAQRDAAREASESDRSGEAAGPGSQATVAWDPEDVPGLEGGPTPPESAGEAEDPEDDPLIGQLLRGKWRVLKRLGAGSYGTVYKVKDEKGDWIEALKILGVDRITGSEAETVRKRFLREAQIMKRLGTESPHIVGLSTYEEDIEAGLVYFLMEFVEGKPLSDVVQEEGPLSVERTLELALQACDALIVAHHGDDGVVHRDLKLENLMLTKDRSGQEIVKVLDFGIAKLAEQDPDSRLTTVGTLGTPGYAAPEQIRAEDVDARTDLFAFGVILYSLLTGRDPWLGNPAGEPTHQIYDLMAASERGAVKPVSETGVEVPPAMESVVMRLLRRDPNERFQSAKELKEVLKRLAAGEEVATGAMLRVLTEEEGVEVEVRSGRHTVTRGGTPCIVADLSPGTYKVLIRDPRFEPLETTVRLETGAIEDVTVVTRARAQGVGATLKRRSGLVAGLAVAILLAAGTLVVQPWGRTLELADFQARAGRGEITSVRMGPDGIQGDLALGFVTTPVKASGSRTGLTAAVQALRADGVRVDTSWEVRRLIDLAARAQSEMRYFDEEGEAVADYAQRAAALEPENPEARSLLLKVGERMAWDAEAALAEGSSEAARELLDECLSLVPEHPRCIRVQERVAGGP